MSDPQTNRGWILLIVGLVALALSVTALIFTFGNNASAGLASAGIGLAVVYIVIGTMILKHKER